MKVYSTILKIRRDIKHRWLAIPWFDVQSTDCFIASWPRSGNTWLRSMVYVALHPGNEPTLDRLDEAIPELDYIEFPERLAALNDQPHRIVKSHEYGREEYLKGRVVYIIRDGRDAILSWYKFRHAFGQTSNSLSTFVRRCSQGRVRYGSWQANVKSWMRFEGHPNLLILKYEDMLSSPEIALRATLSHFGIDVGDESIAEAVTRCSVGTVNSTLSELARRHGKEFAGGLGGGSGRGKIALRDTDMTYFMSKAGDTLRALGYDVEPSTAST